MNCIFCGAPRQLDGTCSNLACRASRAHPAISRALGDPASLYEYEHAKVEPLLLKVPKGDFTGPLILGPKNSHLFEVTIERPTRFTHLRVTTVEHQAFLVDAIMVGLKMAVGATLLTRFVFDPKLDAPTAQAGQLVKVRITNNSRYEAELSYYLEGQQV